MTPESALLTLVLVAGLYVLAQIRIVRDSERLAVSRQGAFRELRGPGLVLAPRLPGIRHQRISYRAPGVIQSDERVDVDGLMLPYESLAPLAAGTGVRIVGFAPQRVHVEPSPD